MPWYVLYTKPRNEKKVTQLLTDKGVEVYCPIQETIKQWSDRKKKVMEPIFRSYVFVKMKDYKEESVDVLLTPGVVRFLWWQQKPGVVREEEIILIKEFLNNYKNSDIKVEIKQGQDVTITEGPLKDNKGTVIRVQGNKAYLHIKSLGLNLVATLALQTLTPIK